MAQTEHSESAVSTLAVSNTGPLISAFQSNSFPLLIQIFAAVHLPTSCVSELVKHGWNDEIQAASDKMVVAQLTASEEKQAVIFARKIAKHPASANPVPENHLGEAQAIVLAFRPLYRRNVLLLDELIAWDVAKQAGLRVSGFPGVLLLATQLSLISADELKVRLVDCRWQGTHYSSGFIQQVYEMAKQTRR